MSGSTTAGTMAGARATAEAWLAGYLDAWETNDPAEIGRLFEADARYLPSPWAAPWWGRDEIVRKWLDHRDEPGTWRFDGRVLAVDGDVAAIVGTTTYLARPDRPKTRYSNLWVVRLGEDGMARSFQEWWVAAPDGRPSGTTQPGAGA